MKIDIRKFMAVVLVVLSLTVNVGAQNSTMTPYSRLGYGMLNDNTTSAQRAMGGVGYAMSSGEQVNVMNPASYAAIDSLTFLFDMGVNLDFLNASENGAKENNLSGGLDYVTMTFPISHRIGASIGLLPFSSTGYEFSTPITNANTVHNGTGEINQLYVGAAYNPFANLYLGFNMAYMFGSTVNDVYSTATTGGVSMFERYMKLHDWHLDLGIQYPIKIGADKLTLGLTYSPAKDLNGETYGLYYDYTSQTASHVDTIGYTKLKGLYSMPATYGAGINYKWRDRLMAEVDFTYQPWSKAKYAKLEDFEDTRLADRWKLSFGLQYTPHPRGSYLKKVNYRLGAYINHDYLMIGDNNLREFGVTAGFGFPIPGYKSTVNLSFAYKHRQANPNPLVKENYFCINLGVNFNEMWFYTRKLH